MPKRTRDNEADDDDASKESKKKKEDSSPQQVKETLKRSRNNESDSDEAPKDTEAKEDNFTQRVPKKLKRIQSIERGDDRSLKKTNEEKGDKSPQQVTKTPKRRINDGNYSDGAIQKETGDDSPQQVTRPPKRTRNDDSGSDGASNETKKKKANNLTKTENLTHRDYTVGWVCALPKEQTAATAMLDRRHSCLPKPPGDENAYTLGSIGNHNIVIACLPKGKIGTIPAATVASWMTSTFPSIKFGLMVGIGGGIPPKVRLGDVVVSVPAGEFPGVVQWDFGKAGTDGHFERTGALNNPPNSLLTALTKLETEHELNGPKTFQYLEEMNTKWPRLAAKYSKSESLEDLLFKAEYNHVNKSATTDETTAKAGTGEENCQLCDRNMTIQRKPRDTQVHYGLIASGNQVIKDAAFRDELNKSLGGQVLCVEMEAAGLMNSFPCIVIRGICDYADTHKNKDWQEYAAAVAAAFTKELLGFVQPSDVDGEPTMEDALSDVKYNLDKIKSKLDQEEEVKILNWLTQVDYGPQQTDYINRREKGTGQWLLESTEYQKWLETGKQRLFCPGIPGAGKTIIASIVIDDITTRFHSDEDVGIACLYCNFRRKDEQNVDRLLASLLKQLSQGRSQLPSCVKVLYEKHKDKRMRPSFDELSNALQSVLETYSQVYIIVDALDELQAHDGSRTKLLSSIFSFQAKHTVNLFATSRPIPDIEAHFNECLRKEIIASDADVQKYVSNHIQHLPKFILSREDVQKEIVSKITAAAKGMFLLVQLHFNSLKDRTSVTEIRTALKKFEQQSQKQAGNQDMRDVLDHAYEQAMERIDGQMLGFRQIGRKALSWICCAKRPLTKAELQHALSVSIGDKEVDKDNLRRIEDVISMCAGLITFDEESDILRLVHYTAQIYFERTQQVWFQDVETDLATACIVYLSFDAFASGPCFADDEFEQRLQENPLYDYAARNWGHHARRGSKRVKRLALEFLLSETKVSASIQAMLVKKLFKGDSGYARRIPNQRRCTHLAGFFGLVDILLLLKTEYNLDQKDSHGRTPLSLAAEHGHEAAVQALLEEARITLDAEDFLYLRTPLSWAAGNGHFRVVKLLLAQPGVEPNSRDRDRRTPLSWAAGNGHKDVVELLLTDDRVDPGSRATWFLKGRTPLVFALLNAHDAVVKLLLDTNKVHPDDKDDDGRTPLSHAAQHGSEELVQLMLATKKVNPDSEDSDKLTPLWWALKSGKIGNMKALIVAGRANPDVRDRSSQTPFSWAAKNGIDAAMALLINTGNVDVNAKDDVGWTPLRWALKNQHHKAVILLLNTEGIDINALIHHGETLLKMEAKYGLNTVITLLKNKDGIDVNFKDPSGSTPLMWALHRGHWAAASLLLNTKAVDINAANHQGDTPLILAASNGNDAAISILLDREGIEVNARNAKGETALFCAVSNGHEAAVSRLLGHSSVDINSKTTRSQTPLHQAAANGNLKLVQLLLQRGAERTARNYTRYTPISLAVEHNHESVVQFMLENDDDQEVKSVHNNGLLLQAARKGFVGIVKLLLQNGAKIDATDYFNRTALLIAVSQGYESMIQLLLEKGADIETTGRFLYTPLLQAVSDDNKAVAKILLDRGAHIEARDAIHQTPLLQATRYNNEAMVKLLLDRGAHIEAKDAIHQTPLLQATRYNNEAMVKLLLDNGANIEARCEKYGFTSLLYAVNDGSETLVRILLERGAATGAVDNHGLTALSLAILRGFDNVVKLLLEQEVDLEAKDNHGLTALWLAVSRKNEALVGALLKKGADIEVKDEEDRTPLQWAAEHGCDAIVGLLQGQQ